MNVSDVTLDDGGGDELDDKSDEEDGNPGLDDLAFDLGPVAPERNTKVKPGSQRSSELDRDRLVKMYISQQRQQNAFNQKLIDQIATQNKVIETLAGSGAAAQKTPQVGRTTTITEPSMADQSWWVKGDFSLVDNKADKLELGLRWRLGAINSDPKVIITIISS